MFLNLNSELDKAWAVLECQFEYGCFIKLKRDATGCSLYCEGIASPLSL